MDSDSIEQYAVNAVVDSIHESPILKADISKGDKIPSWDGHVIVYKSSSKKKDNIDGKIDVQVKGENNNNHSPKTISYSAEVSDLRNYYNNGGVIYFVVRIHKTEPTKRKKIYYETLTPVKIHSYLKEIGNQKKKSIRLKEFPDDNNVKTEIFLNFLNESRKQTSYTKTGFISVEEIKNNGANYTKHFEVLGYSSSDKKTLFPRLFEHEIYMYVSIEGSNAKIPVDEPFSIEKIIKEREGKISVNGRDYYNNFEVITSTEGMSVKIGDSTTVTFGKLEGISEKVSAQMNFTLSPFLRKRENDIRFILAVANEKRFNIGSLELPLNSFEELPSDFISEMERLLVADQRIIKMLELLDVDEDIDTQKLNEDQNRNIEILVKSFIDQKDIPSLRNNKPIMNIIIAPNITLKLIINEGKIFNFFNASISFTLKEDDGGRIEVPPYFALLKEDYLKISNINYRKMLLSYQEFADGNTKIFSLVNNDILKMLSAYDEKPNSKLLEAAKEIAYWILTDERNHDVGGNILILNYLQIIKRERPLAPDEEAQLYEIIENQNANEQEKIGAYLLLDNQLSAERHWDNLDNDEKDKFREFPIYRFWSLASNEK
ncbi:MAG: DUF4365 domain-containing protein [Rikenellaceae bacterium]|jgi:hypothetical protein|nr:DUF4365 domain-containing protein [Rikenellaceae bacterium]